MLRNYNAKIPTREGEVNAGSRFEVPILSSFFVHFVHRSFQKFGFFTNIS
jgi:hypothetical protein